jgi:hypothetical protein
MSVLRVLSGEGLSLIKGIENVSLPRKEHEGEEAVDLI